MIVLCAELVRHEKAIRTRREAMVASDGDASDVLAWLDACDRGDRVLQAIEEERQERRDEAEAHEIEAAR